MSQTGETELPPKPLSQSSPITIGLAIIMVPVILAAGGAHVRLTSLEKAQADAVTVQARLNESREATAQDVALLKASMMDLRTDLAEIKADVKSLLPRGSDRYRPARGHSP